MGGGTGDYQANVRQPLLVRHQGGARLEAHIPLVEMGIRPVDIGRIGDNHRKTRCIRQGLEPAAVPHCDGQPQGGAVGAGQDGGVRHPIHRPYIGIRSL